MLFEQSNDIQYTAKILGGLHYYGIFFHFPNFFKRKFFLRVNNTSNGSSIPTHKD